MEFFRGPVDSEIALQLISVRCKSNQKFYLKFRCWNLFEVLILVIRSILDRFDGFLCVSACYGGSSKWSNMGAVEPDSNVYSTFA